MIKFGISYLKLILCIFFKKNHDNITKYIETFAIILIQKKLKREMDNEKMRCNIPLVFNM